METIKVETCQSCPFANNDNEYGFDGCNLKDIELTGWEQLPEEDVHKECPLKEKDFVIKLKDQHYLQLIEYEMQRFKLLKLRTEYKLNK